MIRWAVAAKWSEAGSVAVDSGTLGFFPDFIDAPARAREFGVSVPAVGPYVVWYERAEGRPVQAGVSRKVPKGAEQVGAIEAGRELLLVDPAYVFDRSAYRKYVRKLERSLKWGAGLIEGFAPGPFFVVPTGGDGSFAVELRLDAQGNIAQARVCLAAPRQLRRLKNSLMPP